MNLNKKKELSARTLGVGKGRIIFNSTRLEEIKEAITKQDIRDLFASGAISVKEIKGRRKIEKRESRRKAGSVRKVIKPGKHEYVTITRKLRSHLYGMKQAEKITQEQFEKIRKEIRARNFKSKAQFKERLEGLK